MSCIDELHLGDWGTELLFPITECTNGISSAVDITNASSIEVRFEKYGGEVLTVTGSIYTGGEIGTGEDGIIEYITIEGDIDTLGKWKVQATITFPTGEYNSSVNKTIKVLDNI